MNSALKPVLAQQPGGQASPAKANVATANHAVGLPQGAQNSLHHASLVGQNLTAHVPAAQPLPHAAPSMAPVTANMAQMAQNMSHHGNLSHVTQNSVTPTNMAASPSKSASTSAPLSLVQDKPTAPTPSQPLALTRTPEKKEPDSTGHANGTIDSPKSGANAPASLKPHNPEPNKDKQDIAKTSPSTPKPPEKPSTPNNAPNTPQKSEGANNPVSQTDGPVQPKVATANEPAEKSPSKPTELKPSPTADVAPTQSDSKPVPESANDSQLQEKPATPTKPEASTAESSKTESPAKPEEKKEEPKVEESQDATENKEEKLDKSEPAKEEPEPEQPQKVEKVEAPIEKVEEKKPDVKTPAKEVKPTPKSTLKLATVTPPMRKRRQASLNKTADGPSPPKKAASEAEVTPDSRSKRNRTKVQLYQSPTPEITLATKLSASTGRSTPTKPNDDKLIVFYKNEYLAVRNAEGGFYVCQAVQNVYRSTRKIKIRWLSQDKADPSGETYRPDFYDVTDMECVLTTLSMSRASAGGAGAQQLAAAERARAQSILERALRAEHAGAGGAAAGNCIELTEEHPDGLDLSLYTDESQLDKKRKRGSKASPRKDAADETAKGSPTPVKKARTTPKRSPKSARKSKSTATPPQTKRKPAGTTPSVATTGKVGIVQRIYRNTATAVTEKAKAKSTPKRTPVKKETPAVTTPARKGRRSTAESKAIVPTPSTSTGKATRTPRKPPAKK
ncbi:proteoglycan 4-like isoform X2 [Plodia interpunctella]|uniref:proteoglycan 4-like isoform X2 n=1 Tax=Plodia interpunctella TaxID=58824 RepID=UPI002367BDDB|nr:proteoglycan 4-like isoform X2 [Plodia interpunctella]